MVLAGKGAPSTHTNRGKNWIVMTVITMTGRMTACAKRKQHQCTHIIQNNQKIVVRIITDKMYTCNSIWSRHIAMCTTLHCIYFYIRNLDIKNIIWWQCKCWRVHEPWYLSQITILMENIQLQRTMNCKSSPVCIWQTCHNCYIQCIIL